MKLERYCALKENFDKQIENIECEIRSNKRSIERLAIKQRKLKETRKGMYEVLRGIREEQNEKT